MGIWATFLKLEWARRTWSGWWWVRWHCLSDTRLAAWCPAGLINIVLLEQKCHNVKVSGMTFSSSRTNPSSHTRLASPEVVDRGLAESVLEPSIGVGTFKKDFFCLTQVWPLAWVLLLCRATVYDAGPALSSTCLVTGSITDSSHHISPDTRRYMRQGLINAEPMSQTVGQH